MMKYNID